MDLLQAFAELPNLMADYKATAARLMETERELSALKAEKYVGIDWVAGLWSVDTDTARKMIQVLATGPKRLDIKVLSYGPKIVRYRRSDIEKITENSLVTLRDVLARKRAARRAG